MHVLGLSIIELFYRGSCRECSYFWSKGLNSGNKVSRIASIQANIFGTAFMLPAHKRKGCFIFCCNHSLSLYPLAEDKNIKMVGNNIWVCYTCQVLISISFVFFFKLKQNTLSHLYRATTRLNSILLPDWIHCLIQSAPPEFGHLCKSCKYDSLGRLS